MEQQVAAKLLEENLHTIFSWAMSKLYDKNDAEDLAHDVICAVLSSVSRLQNDAAFFGFMWRTADNMLKAYIRRKRSTAVFDESFRGVYWESPESELISSEDNNLLRRELSLLSHQYREATIGHYIYGKSCSELSAELGISPETVKLYLFKTRKLLKEGIGMTREFGEKSYNPAIFRPDFWTNGSNIEYQELFKRRLPGNILLAAYDKPLTITELSLELGVATAYLEDELNILRTHDIIREVSGKYQTNIVIFTDEYEKHISAKFKPYYEAAAQRFSAELDDLLPELFKLDFYGNDYTHNVLKWTFANIALYLAMCKADDMGVEKYGSYPLLSNGVHGFIFGYDNDYVNHHFNGIYGCCKAGDIPAWFSAVNYRFIENVQKWQSGPNWNKSISALLDAALFKNADINNDEIVRYISEGYISSAGGKLSPNFPVFTKSVFKQVENLLTPCVNAITGYIEEVCSLAAITLKDYVPRVLKDKCAHLAYIHHQMDAIAFIAETMAANGQLFIPDKKANLCMFAVDES
ncbi:MAG: sigma-70 family RNA polymerase sigma factor [Oscillospiraceae bacterium]|nr:sigma-70 family RNA polymerase sigma factor [Oscillospiraceae bacterium]